MCVCVCACVHACVCSVIEIVYVNCVLCFVEIMLTGCRI